MKKIKGFTLIELLIVAVIIGIISGVSYLTWWGNIQQKTRDVQRITDVNNIKLAVENFFEKNSKYPPLGATYNTQTLFSSDTVPAGATDWIPELVPNFIKELPKDPKQTSWNPKFIKDAYASHVNWTTSTIIDDPNLYEDDSSLVALDNNKLFLTYTDDNNLVFIKSTDGGISWSSPVIIAANGPVQYNLDVIDENTLFNLFNDGRLKLAKSVNGGTNWTTTTVDPLPLSAPNASMDAVNSNTVFVSYYDFSNYDLQFAKSTDGGNNWTLSTIESAGQIGGGNKIKAIDGNNIFITYQDSTNHDIKFAKSTNGGTNWTTNIIASLDPAGVGVAPQIAALDSNNIFVLYEDANTQTLKFAKSTNGGTNWTTISSIDIVRFDKQLAVLDSNNILVSYRQRIGFDDALKIAESTNGGNSWQIQQIALLDDLSEPSMSSLDFNSVFISYTTDNANSSFLELTKSIPSSSPSVSPAPPFLYLYHVSADRRSYNIWAWLENSKDPRIYTNSGAACKTTPPPEIKSQGYNFCGGF